MSSRGSKHVVQGGLVLALVVLLAPVAIAGGPPGFGTKDDFGYYYVFALDPTFETTGGAPVDVAWLTDLIDEIGNNQVRPGPYYFGLVVADPGSDSWSKHVFPNNLFYGDTGDMIGAIQSYATPSVGPEGVDGIAGVQEAIQYPWTKIMALVTDGPSMDWGGSFNDARLGLDPNVEGNKRLNAIVDHGFTDGSGTTTAMGTYWNAFPPSLGRIRSYLDEPSSSGPQTLPFTRVRGGGAPEGLGDPGVHHDYIELAKYSRGSGWDMNTAGTEGFRKAFADVKIEELGGFGGGGYVPEPSTWILMLSAGGILGVLARRRRRR